LQSSVGWDSSKSDEMMNKILSAAIVAVVAEDTFTHQVIGCALLLGDEATFYYVKDVIVHPKWQGKRVGTAMMNMLNTWLEKKGEENALAGLFTREMLEPFYQQFGFAQSFAMLKFIKREK
jgi:GNAT superfamily N-acetyltransferase